MNESAQIGRVGTSMRVERLVSREETCGGGIGFHISDIKREPSESTLESEDSIWIQGRSVCSRNQCLSCVRWDAW